MARSMQSRTEIEILRDCIKICFFEKKIKPTTCGLDLARVGKGEGIPDNTTPKSYFLFFC